MGMVGQYIKINGEDFDKIKAGILDLFELSENLTIANSNDIMDIDKSWHALHYVLSGKPWGIGKKPISKMVLSGNELGEETDSGYGPAMYLTAREVSEIVEAANKVDMKWFRKRFNVAKMKKNKIYLAESVESEEFFEYVWSNFNEAKTFFEKAASKKQCIIFSIC